MKTELKSLALAAAMAVSMAVPAIAAVPSASGQTEINRAGGNGSSRLELNVVYDEGTIHGDMFSAVIPAVIPIAGQVNKVDAICPSNIEVRNNNVERAIQVTGLQVNSNSWTVVDYDGGNYSSGKNIGVQFNNEGTNGSGRINVASGNWVVPASGKLALPMKAKISKQNRPVSNVDAATVVFTLNFV